MIVLQRKRGKHGFAIFDVRANQNSDHLARPIYELLLCAIRRSMGATVIRLVSCGGRWKNGVALRPHPSCG
jgi:hypothetical protein